MGENEASLLSDILRARLCDTRPHVTAFGREGRGDYNHEAKSLFGCAFLARETVLRETLRVFLRVTDP